MRLDNIKSLRLQNIIKDFVLDHTLQSRFYGYFCQYIDFRESNVVHTYKPFIDRYGMVVSYNNDFINSLEENEIRYLLIYICFQFISKHNLINVTDESSFVDYLSSSIVISNIIESTMSSNVASNPSFIPKFPSMEFELYTVYHDNKKHLHNINEGVKDYIETNYHGRMSYEDLTDKLISMQNIDPNILKKLEEDTKGMTEDNIEEYEDKLSQYSDVLETMENGINTVMEILESFGKFKEWVETDEFFNSSDKSREYNDILKTLALKQLNLEINLPIQSHSDRLFVDQALSSAKNRGVHSGELDRHLDSLTESRVDYMKLIKSKTSNLLSNSSKRKYTKPNRKGITGLKGKVKYGNAVTCILDTSGSMWDAIEAVLSTIFKHGLQVNLIQIDTEVKDPIVLSSKADFSKINIQGGGGTVIQPAIDYIVENPKYNKHNVVILTDGWTDTLDTSKLKRVLILSVGDECSLTYEGNVTQIIINPEEL